MDINELWARTQAYARRAMLPGQYPYDPLVAAARSIYQTRDGGKAASYMAVAYLAGYDERQQMDNGPTLDRDAALIAFADDRLWHRCTADEKAAYREKATAARIMIGGTYAG